jgi:hypothetical protein
VPSKNVVLPRWYGRAASFDSTRAAQPVGCRWPGNGPRFAAVGPSGAASWRLGHVGAARVGLATLGRLRRWPMVGGRWSAGEAGVAIWCRFVRMWPVTARVRSFHQPPNPPIKRDRLRRGNQGDFIGFGCRVGSLWATRWAAHHCCLPYAEVASPYALART